MTRDSNILLLVLAALLALGGYLVTIGLDSGRLTDHANVAVSCESVLPGRGASVCQGVAEGRYTTQDVLAYPSWDWESIGAGDVSLGMTTRMVEAAWGAPDYINVDGYGESDEEWAVNGRLLGFRGGVLASIDEARIWSVDELLTLAIESTTKYEIETYGKQILLVGEISDAVTALDGSPRVEFEFSDTWNKIECSFLPEAFPQAATLGRGQSIVLLGIGSGTGLSGPTFGSCRVFSR
jgi:hypothetical protein